MAEIEFYASQKLGAVAAISPRSPGSSTRLIQRRRASCGSGSVMGPRRGRLLVARAGRFLEALPARRAGLRMDEHARKWGIAAIAATNLSETELLVGDIVAAVGRRREPSPCRPRATQFRMLSSRIAHADALHAAGELEKAGDLFADAERQQQERQPELPIAVFAAGVSLLRPAPLVGRPPRRAIGRRRLWSGEDAGLCSRLALEL